jgi:hypothetical protein
VKEEGKQSESIHSESRGKGEGKASKRKVRKESGSGVKGERTER